MEVVFNEAGFEPESGSRSLFVAVPSNGNAGQMAADALCCNSSFRKVGLILSAFLVPMSGYDSFGEQRKNELCSPCDIYSADNSGMVVIIQRSACRLGFQRAFYKELSEKLMSVFGKDSTVSILTGAGLETINDPSKKLLFVPPVTSEAMLKMQKNENLSGLMRVVEAFESIPGYVLLGAAGGVDASEQGKIDDATTAQLKKSNPLLDTVLDFSTKVHVNAEKPVGMGGGALLYHFLSGSGVATSIIGNFVYEGDNRDDGIRLARALIEGIFPEQQNAEIITPASWAGIGGSVSRESKNFPAVI
jgi:hypothetical protein